MLNEFSEEHCHLSVTVSEFPDFLEQLLVLELLRLQILLSLFKFALILTDSAIEVVHQVRLIIFLLITYIVVAFILVLFKITPQLLDLLFIFLDYFLAEVTPFR